MHEINGSTFLQICLGNLYAVFFCVNLRMNHWEHDAAIELLFHIHHDISTHSQTWRCHHSVQHSFDRFGWMWIIARICICSYEIAKNFAFNEENNATQSVATDVLFWAIHFQNHHQPLLIVSIWWANVWCNWINICWQMEAENCIHHDTNKSIHDFIPLASIVIQLLYGYVEQSHRMAVCFAISTRRTWNEDTANFQI